MDYGKLYADMEDTLNMLEEEDIGVHFGSSEYAKAKTACRDVADGWKDFQEKTEKNPDYQMTNYEVQQAQKRLDEVKASMDAYIAKKNAEMQVKPLSKAGEYRLEAMKTARASLEMQQEALDALAVERSIERPVPDIETIDKHRKALGDELNDARTGVINGSVEYMDAHISYDRLNAAWDRTMIGKGKDDIPTAGQIQNLRAMIEKTRVDTDAYLEKKAKIQNPDPKAKRRIEAMNRVKDNLEAQTKLLDSWEKKLAEKEPEKDFKTLADDTKYLSDQIAAADKGVMGGSKEYKDVNALLKQQEEKWREFEKKGPDYKLTDDEVKEMDTLNKKTGEAVDKYIASKAGKDLSETTKKRLKAMQKVKDHTLSQTRKIEAQKEVLNKEADAITSADIGEKSKEVTQEIREATKNVHFGSKAFTNAMTDYNRSVRSWQEYTAKEAAGQLTSADTAREKARLESAKKNIDKYLASHKNKDLDKNPKMKKRVEAMQKARDNIDIRLRKVDISIKKQQMAEQARDREEYQVRMRNYQLGTRGQYALQRTVSRASLSASQKLNQLSTKQTLTKFDKRDAKMAIAALILENRVTQPGNEYMRARFAKDSKAYAEAVKNIAESKEFKQTFPDSKITPQTCHNLCSNPRMLHKATMDFDKNIYSNARSRGIENIDVLKLYKTRDIDPSMVKL